MMKADIWTELDGVVNDLRRITEIKAVAIVRRDGLIITHDLPDSVDPKIVAAMSAAIMGTAEMATVQLGQGRLVQTIIESELGKVLATGAGDQALIISLVHLNANLGLVLMALERAARSIDEIIRRYEGA